MKPIPWVTVFLLVACCWPAPAMAGDPEPRLPLDVMAVEGLIRAGHYDDARVLVREARDPMESAPLVVSRFWLETGRSEHALEVLGETRGLKEGRQEHRLAMARLLTFHGRLNEARKHLLAIAESDRNHVECHVRLGLLHLKMGETDPGRTSLKKFLDRANEVGDLSAMDYVWLGRAAVAIGRYHLANEVLYHNALVRDEDCFDAHVDLGELFHSKFDYPEARKCFKKALAINPRYAPAHLGLARAAWEDPFLARRGSVARDALDNVVRWVNHPQWSILSGLFAMASGNDSRAQGHFQDAAQAAPYDQVAQAHLAAIFVLTKQEERLDQLRERVEKLHPKPAQFYATLARRIGRHRQAALAHQFARRATELDPDHAAASFVRGVFALRTGNVREARLWLLKAHELDPFNIWAHNMNVVGRHMDQKFIVDEQEDFTVCLPREDAPYMMSYMRELLEESKQKLEERFKVELPSVLVEAFSDRQRYSVRSVGLPHHRSLGMCFGRLITMLTPRINEGCWGATLVHELTHTAAAVRSDHRVPRWLTEGLAEHAEGYDRPRWENWALEELVDAHLNRRLRPMNRLEYGFRSKAEIYLSYCHARAVCTYIESRWGFDKLLEMLDAYGAAMSDEQVFVSVLEQSTDQFDEGFHRFLDGFVKTLDLGPRYNDQDMKRLRFLAETRGDAASWTAVGMGHLFEGDYDSAQLAVDRAMARDPKHPDLFALRGFLAYAAGREKPARERLASALEHGTRYRYRVKVAYGHLLSKVSGRKQEAVALLTAAVDSYPGRTRGRFELPDPYLLLVDLHTELDQDDHLIEVVKRAVRHRRAGMGPRLMLATHYRERGDWKGVIDAVSDAVYIDPFEYSVHEILANAYVQTDQHEAAIRELSLLLRYDESPRADVHSQLAWCYLKLGKRDQARKHVVSALELDKKNELALEVLAKLRR